ncbi:hypothetical protein Sango_2876900 [Sesamum angolense]|uniref:Transposon Ty3-I Gag-Pol polyprotein n=1 Tax=Sesamum angolense TaxID=2727404 RepID=A0AAE1VZ89_9LAMI|nr:hypothetical protein Sango_2876900 [Sesamum angolense]
MTDLHGISPDIITQRLSVNPNAKPVKQKKRMFGVERSQAIKEEACPKDPVPLLRIDVLVDSTSGCEMLSFLDAYQGYNQILLAPKDQEKVSFVTDLTRLGMTKGAFVDEFPSVLWAYRTMPRTAMGESPFSLSYETETVAPAEIGELRFQQTRFEDESRFC